MKLVPFWRSSLSDPNTPSQKYYFKHFEIHPIKVLPCVLYFPYFIILIRENPKMNPFEFSFTKKHTSFYISCALWIFYMDFFALSVLSNMGPISEIRSMRAHMNIKACNLNVIYFLFTL
jgi:hypothetical protein